MNTLGLEKNNKIKKPHLLTSIFSDKEHKDLQNFAMNLWANDKSTYDKAFGRHQWAIWDNTHLTSVEPLRKFHESLLELARKEFESKTLLPSWCVLSIYEGKEARLWKHVDDNACTYHINYTVFHKTPWDFYVEGEKFSPNENDAVLSYGNEQEHWREAFPNPENNLVVNAFFFYVEPDHWFFTKGPQYLYTDIRAKKDDNPEGMQ